MLSTQLTMQTLRRCLSCLLLRHDWDFDKRIRPLNNTLFFYCGRLKLRASCILMYIGRYLDIASYDSFTIQQILQACCIRHYSKCLARHFKKIYAYKRRKRSMITWIYIWVQTHMNHEFYRKKNTTYRLILNSFGISEYIVFAIYVYLDIRYT